MRVAVITLAILLGFVATHATAQERQIGGKLGPTIAGLAHNFGDADGKYRRKVSLGGGGFVVLPITGRLAVQIEALFTPKGAKLPPDIDVTNTLFIDYLEVPLLGRAIVARSASRSLHVFAGPSAAVRLNAKYRVATSGPIGGTNGFTEDVSSGIERFDMGIVAGGGFDAGRHLVIDARYSWGLRDVNREAFENERVRNRALTILAGVRFDAGRRPRP
jgi:hypothetical protein